VTLTIQKDETTERPVEIQQELITGAVLWQILPVSVCHYYSLWCHVIWSSPDTRDQNSLTVMNWLRS